MKAESLLRAIQAIKSGKPVPPEYADIVASSLSEFIDSGKVAERRRFVFKQTGAGWQVGDSCIRTRKTGFGFIHFMLRHPGKPMPAVTVFHLGRVDPELTNVLNLDAVRTNVQKRVKAALDNISGTDIAAHLKLTLHTGHYLSYMPDPDTGPRWELF